MNKLLFPNGGVPLDGDDFGFLQDAYKEAFTGFVSGFAGLGDLQGFILSGCFISEAPAGTFNVTSGYYSQNGEIFAVPAHVYTPGGDTAFWEIQTTYDPAGDETLQDTTTGQTYQQRTAKIVVSASPPASFTGPSAPTLTTLIDGSLGLTTERARITALEGAWVSLPLVSGNITGADWTFVSGVIKYVITGKTVHLNLQVELTTGASPDATVTVAIPWTATDAIKLLTPSSGVGVNVRPLRLEVGGAAPASTIRIGQLGGVNSTDSYSIEAQLLIPIA